MYTRNEVIKVHLSVNYMAFYLENQKIPQQKSLELIHSVRLYDTNIQITKISYSAQQVTLSYFLYNSIKIITYFRNNIGDKKMCTENFKMLLEKIENNVRNKCAHTLENLILLTCIIEFFF